MRAAWPLDAFGASAVSNKAFEDYIFTPVEYLTKIGSDDVTANLTGSPINDWAGPINTALSREWRNHSYQIDSNSLPTMHSDCAGIAANCTATTVSYSASTLLVPKVSRAVKEGAAELSRVPLLKDQPWAKSLDLNAAYRLAQYEVTGTARTWKVDLTWDVNDQITVRSTRSRDFRAPGAGRVVPRTNGIVHAGFADLMPGSARAKSAAERAHRVGRQSDLKPEISDTLTYGIVFRPNSSFSIAVDAFDIKVQNAIFQTPGQRQCGAVRLLCQQRDFTLLPADRPRARKLHGHLGGKPGGAVAQVFINAANHNTQGVDVEANFRTSIADRP